MVIDPGHGGIDTGTKAASGEQEKSIVLDFATMLRDKLEHCGKYRVAMTRSDDTFVALTERVKFARSLKASLFVSIHADYLPKRKEGEAQGATVYTLSETASDSEAARLAEDENKADVIAGVDLTAESNEVADILIDLAQRETKAFSIQFARDADRRAQDRDPAAQDIRRNRRASSFSARRMCRRCCSSLAMSRPRTISSSSCRQSWREQTTDAHGAGDR